MKYYGKYINCDEISYKYFNNEEEFKHYNKAVCDCMYNNNIECNIEQLIMIEVEGYKCIAFVKNYCAFDGIEIDKIIYPFDKTQNYPIQSLVLEYRFWRWSDGDKEI